MTLVLAGHGTTATALAWTWYLLAQHPAVEAALLAELRAVGGRRPTLADLPRLTYTEAIFTEALRLYPPVWATGREARRDCQLGGTAAAPARPIRSGTIVVMSQWVLQRDPRFFEQPDEFVPERWLDGLAKRLPKFAYFPFGGGPRICMGNGFAMMEAVLILATIAQQARPTLMPGQSITPWPTAALRPRPGVRMVPLRRAPVGQA
jgi:cytochrome P450